MSRRATDQLPLDLDLPRPIITGAHLSDDGFFRYKLWRTWGDASNMLGWVMLNPSIADHETDDQTIRRCCYFARREGYGGIIVYNLYAYRTAYPKLLWETADRAGGIEHSDIIGPQNDRMLAIAAEYNPAIKAFVAAWGNLPGAARARRDVVLGMFAEAGRDWLCLGTTLSGHPRHPSRLPDKTELTPWTPTPTPG